MQLAIWWRNQWLGSFRLNPIDSWEHPFYSHIGSYILQSLLFIARTRAISILYSKLSPFSSAESFIGTPFFLSFFHRHLPFFHIRLLYLFSFPSQLFLFFYSQFVFLSFTPICLFIHLFNQFLLLFLLSFLSFFFTIYYFFPIFILIFITLFHSSFKYRTFVEFHLLSFFLSFSIF